MEGVNKKIAMQIGLTDLKVLDPRRDTLSKLVTFIPTQQSESVIQALHEAGAGNIGNYRNCSFRVMGTGTFLPSEHAAPRIGKIGQLEKVNELRVEMIFPRHLESHVIKTLKEAHPYEEVAYYLSSLNTEDPEVGAGMIGEFKNALEPMEFLSCLKLKMNSSCVRHTVPPGRKIKKAALCGGTRNVLLQKAIAAGGDGLVVADFL